MLCEVEVAKEKDLGVNDERFIIRTHLGFVLKPGDYALGYDLRTCNFNHDESDLEFPEIVLVRKHYPRTIRMERNWKIKSLTAEEPDKPGYGLGASDEMDMEIFMRDLEEDKDMREKVNMYKKNNNNKKQKAADSMEQETKPQAGDWPPGVPLDELLDDLHIKNKDELDDDNLSL